MSTPVRHGRGTAAEQGAAIRRQMEERQRKRRSHAPISSFVDRPTSSDPAGAGAAHRAPSSRRRAAPEEGAAVAGSRPPPVPAPTHEPNSDNTVRSAGSGSGNGEKQQKKPKKINRHNPFAMNRLQSLTGIDNLALLMENESYHPACFSVYCFESDLDRATVDAFFEKLIELFPKYTYRVELDPAKAVKQDKRARKYLDQAGGDPEKAAALADQAGEVLGAGTDGFDPGRKTGYAKGIKAGGPFRPAKWRILDDFDATQNIEEETVSEANNGDDALFRVAGKFLEQHFNYAKPLWEAKIVHGLHTSDGSRSALMIKIHHALSDGQGLIQSYGVALEAMATGASKEEVQQKLESSQEQKKPGQRGVTPTVWATIKHGTKTLGGLYFRSRKCFTYKSKHQERTAGRRYAHSKGISLDDIKLIREAFSTPQERLTLNDVACALISRSMGIAAKRVSPRGEIEDKRIAIFVPISIRPKGNYELANMTTGAIAWFKLDETLTLEERLAQVNREMMRIKRSYLPRIWYNTFDFICKRRVWYAPNYPVAKTLFQKAVREYSPVTNVPGPSRAVKFGEHVAKRYFVMPPSSPGKSTLAIGIISYANQLSVAVSCDDVPEFETLCQEICESFQEGAAELIQQAKERIQAKKERA